MTIRSLVRRVKCAAGFHRPVEWYVFVSPKHPRYELQWGCLWCSKRFK